MALLKFRWLSLAVCVSVALNAALIQQLFSPELGYEHISNMLFKVIHGYSDCADEARYPISGKILGNVVNLSKKEILSSFDVDDIMNLGKLFYYEYTLSMMIDDESAKNMGIDLDAEVETALTGTALDMVSHALSAKEKNNWKLSKKSTIKLKERLDKHGIAVIQSLHSPECCRKVAYEAQQKIMNPTAPFSFIRIPKFRKDYRLTLEGETFNIIRQTMILLEPFFTAMIGPDAWLVEHSAFTTYAKAAVAQQWHSDSGAEFANDLGKIARYFSVFIYLDDVESDQGPLEAIPGSHTHAFFIEDDEELIPTAPYLRLVVPQGTIVIYDSQLKHRGGSNTAKLARPTILFSLMENANKHGPNAPSLDLRDVYRTNETLVTITDVIANEVIPEPFKTVALKRHDDKECLEQIHRLCPTSTFGKDPDILYACAYYYFTGGKAVDDEEWEDGTDMDEVKRITSMFGEIEYDDQDNVQEIVKKLEIKKSEYRKTLRKERHDMLDKEGNVNPRAAVVHMLQQERNPNPFAFDKRLNRCGLLSRVEMLLERGVFAKDYQPLVSWGSLNDNPMT